MKIEIQQNSIADFEKVMVDNLGLVLNHENVHTRKAGAITAKHYLFNNEKISGGVLFATLDSDLFITRCKVNIKEKLVVHQFPTGNKDSLTVTFVNSTSVESEVFNEDRSFANNYAFGEGPLSAYFLTTQDLNMVKKFPANATVQTLTLSFKISWLREVFGENLNDWISDALQGNYAITANMGVILVRGFKKVFECNPSKGGFLIELKTAVFQLLISLNDILNSSTINQPKRVNYNDLVQVAKAEKVIIDSILKDFPSNRALAQEASMSLSKFVKNFKLIYGTTPYEYYQEHRLNYARDLINSNLASITEAGKLIGYKSLSHFSIAYKKQFGVLPSKDK